MEFEVKEVFPYGSVELWNEDKSTSFKINGHRFQLYYGGESLRTVASLRLFALAWGRIRQASLVKEALFERHPGHFALFFHFCLFAFCK